VSLATTIVADAAGVTRVLGNTALVASKDVTRIANAYTTVRDLTFASLT
jgi:hypothetical protein